jgi:hypothetical protein
VRDALEGVIDDDGQVIGHAHVLAREHDVARALGRAGIRPRSPPGP